MWDKTVKVEVKQDSLLYLNISSLSYPKIDTYLVQMYRMGKLISNSDISSKSVWGELSV